MLSIAVYSYTKIFSNHSNLVYYNAYNQPRIFISNGSFDYTVQQNATKMTIGIEPYGSYTKLHYQNEHFRLIKYSLD